MTTFDETTSFIRDRTGYRKSIEQDDNLDRDIGVYGDDMADFLDAYAERFDVDMSGYLWYFHTGEEGQNIGALFFASPNARVEHIPVTPALLLRRARLGTWDVDYPDHDVPDRRLDIRVNQAIAVVVLTALVVGTIWKYLFR